MTSLYNRATPSQARILRIVEGAVKNAADAHPTIEVSKRFARSVAKRAAGTLSAQWPEVLAASILLSETANGERVRSLSSVRSQSLSMATGRRASQTARRSPLPFIIKQLSILAGQARKAGQTECLDALIDALRIVSAAHKSL